MCQADDGATGEDGVAPEGALHLSEGEGAEAILQKHFSHPSDLRFAANSQKGKPLGQVGYEASVRGFDNSDVDFGTWDDLDPVVKALWEDIAAAILKAASSQSPTEEATSVADTVHAASEQGESPDGDRAVVNEAAGASSPFGLPSLSQDRQVYRTSELPEEWVEAIKNSQAAGHDATCPLCGEKCDAFAGNPGKWPIPLAKDFLCVYHHMGCVSAIVYRERDTRPKEAKAREILAQSGLEDDGDFVIEFDPLMNAITSALSQAYEDGRLHERKIALEGEPIDLDEAFGAFGA